MAEALRATNAFMFEAARMHRIMANYRPENLRSGRLLERLGFVAGRATRRTTCSSTERGATTSSPRSPTRPTTTRWLAPAR